MQPQERNISRMETPFLYFSTPSDKITKNILGLLGSKSAEIPPNSPEHAR
jgi:hypothetical protein